MTAKPHAPDGRLSPAAGAVLLWCVLAGALVSAILLVEPPPERGLEFWTPSGAFGLLADLAIVYVLFLVPLFARRKTRPFRAAVESASIILFTTLAGLTLLNALVGLDGPTVGRLVAFIVLVCAGALVWWEVLPERQAVYYSVAALAAFGVPIAAFFIHEFFRLTPSWLDNVSPVTAAALVRDSSDVQAPWIIAAVVLVSGLVMFVVRLRRFRP